MFDKYKDAVNKLVKYREKTPNEDIHILSVVRIKQKINKDVIEYDVTPVEMKRINND